LERYTASSAAAVSSTCVVPLPGSAASIGLGIDDGAIRSVNLMPGDLAKVVSRKPRLLPVLLPIAAVVPLAAVGLGERLPARELERRAVARAHHRAGLLVPVAFAERTVVVRAAVLDGVERPAAVEDADLDAVGLDELSLARRDLIDVAHGHGFWHAVMYSRVPS